MYEQKTKKHTKIVATISDRNCDVEFLKKLYQEGMNVVRVNTAHQEPEDTKKVIEAVKQVSPRIGIMIDTKGPEVRTRTKDVISLVQGEKIKMSYGDMTTDPKHIKVSYQEFVQELDVSKRVLIDDGLVELIVVEKTPEYLVCEVMNSGEFKGNKSVNTPGTFLNLPALSEKDKKFVEFAIKEKVAFIAHSFVRNKEDVIQIQDMLDKHKSSTRIIAKIEDQEGVNNIDEILDNVFGIMIARGDLAMEIPGPRVPIVQKELIKKAREAQKVCIVATQMLHSMIDHPRPTRAEMNDIATAIYDKADAVMLSGETAYGKYPVESVMMMTQIAEEVESELAKKMLRLMTREYENVPDFLSSAAVLGAARLDAKAIIVDTTYGTTPMKLTLLRGSLPIYSFCYNELTAQQLSLCYGIYTTYLEPVTTSDEFVSYAVSYLLKHQLVSQDDLLVAIAGNFEPQLGASFIEISAAKNLLRGKKN